MTSTAKRLVQVLLITSSVFTACQAVCDGTSCPSGSGTCDAAGTCWCDNQKGGDNCGLSCADDCSLTDGACEALNTCTACDPVCDNGDCTAFGYPATAGIACKCDVGWTGDACDEVDCTNSPCANGGTCDTSGATDVCNCVAGYTGQICDQNIDDCDPNPCLNGGTCTDGVNTYTCACADGYTGTDCADVDCSTTSPCLNGGTCDDSPATHKCTCATGFAGLICHQVDCTGDPCVEGTCNATPDPDVCACDTGYAGLICDKADPCTPNPCQNEGNCTISGEGYSCDCAVGFTGDNCESGASRMTTALPLMLAALFIFKSIN